MVSRNNNNNTNMAHAGVMSGRQAEWRKDTPTKTMSSSSSSTGHFPEKRRPTRQCMCQLGDACGGMSAAFAILKDPRGCFVELPTGTEDMDPALVQAYCQYLRPNDDDGLLLLQDRATDENKTNHDNNDSSGRPLKLFVAVHHFDPTVIPNTPLEQRRAPDLLPFSTFGANNNHNNNTTTTTVMTDAQKTLLSSFVDPSSVGWILPSYGFHQAHRDLRQAMQQRVQKLQEETCAKRELRKTRRKELLEKFANRMTSTSKFRPSRSKSPKNNLAGTTTTTGSRVAPDTGSRIRPRRDTAAPVSSRAVRRDTAAPELMSTFSMVPPPPPTNPAQRQDSGMPSLGGTLPSTRTRGLAPTVETVREDLQEHDAYSSSAAAIPPPTQPARRQDSGMPSFGGTTTASTRIRAAPTFGAVQEELGEHDTAEQVMPPPPTQPARRQDSGMPTSLTGRPAWRQTPGGTAFDAIGEEEELEPQDTFDTAQEQEEEPPPPSFAAGGGNRQDSGMPDFTMALTGPPQKTTLRQTAGTAFDAIGEEEEEEEEEEEDAFDSTASRGISAFSTPPRIRRDTAAPGGLQPASTFETCEEGDSAVFDTIEEGDEEAEEDSESTDNYTTPPRAAASLTRGFFTPSSAVSPVVAFDSSGEQDTHDNDGRDPSLYARPAKRVRHQQQQQQQRAIMVETVTSQDSEDSVLSARAFFQPEQDLPSFRQPPQQGSPIKTSTSFFPPAPNFVSASDAARTTTTTTEQQQQPFVPPAPPNFISASDAKKSSSSNSTFPPPPNFISASMAAQDGAPGDVNAAMASLAARNQSMAAGSGQRTIVQQQQARGFVPPTMPNFISASMAQENAQQDAQKKGLFPPPPNFISASEARKSQFPPPPNFISASMAKDAGIMAPQQQGGPPGDVNTAMAILAARNRSMEAAASSSTQQSRGMGFEPPPPPNFISASDAKKSQFPPPPNFISASMSKDTAGAAGEPGSVNAAMRIINARNEARAPPPAANPKPPESDEESPLDDFRSLLKSSHIKVEQSEDESSVSETDNNDKGIDIDEDDEASSGSGMEDVDISISDPGRPMEAVFGEDIENSSQVSGLSAARAPEGDPKFSRYNHRQNVGTFWGVVVILAVTNLHYAKELKMEQALKRAGHVAPVKAPVEVVAPTKPLDSIPHPGDSAGDLDPAPMPTLDLDSLAPTASPAPKKSWFWKSSPSVDNEEAHVADESLNNESEGGAVEEDTTNDSPKNIEAEDAPKSSSWFWGSSKSAKNLQTDDLDDAVNVTDETPAPEGLAGGDAESVSEEESVQQAPEVTEPKSSSWFFRRSPKPSPPEDETVSSSNDTETMVVAESETTECSGCEEDGDGDATEEKPVPAEPAPKSSWFWRSSPTPATDVEEDLDGADQQSKLAVDDSADDDASAATFETAAEIPDSDTDASVGGAAEAKQPEEKPKSSWFWKKSSPTDTVDVLEVTVPAEGKTEGSDVAPAHDTGLEEDFYDAAETNNTDAAEAGDNAEPVAGGTVPEDAPKSPWFWRRPTPAPATQEELDDHEAADTKAAIGESMDTSEEVPVEDAASDSTNVSSTSETVAEAEARGSTEDISSESKKKDDSASRSSWFWRGKSLHVVDESASSVDTNPDEGTVEAARSDTDASLPVNGTAEAAMGDPPSDPAVNTAIEPEAPAGNQAEDGAKRSSSWFSWSSSKSPGPGASTEMDGDGRSEDSTGEETTEEQPEAVGSSAGNPDVAELGGDPSASKDSMESPPGDVVTSEEDDVSKSDDASLPKEEVVDGSKSKKSSWFWKSSSNAQEKLNEEYTAADAGDVATGEELNITETESDADDSQSTTDEPGSEPHSQVTPEDEPKPSSRWSLWRSTDSSGTVSTEPMESGEKADSGHETEAGASDQEASETDSETVEEAQTAATSATETEGAMAATPEGGKSSLADWFLLSDDVKARLAKLARKTPTIATEEKGAEETDDGDVNHLEASGETVDTSDPPSGDVATEASTAESVQSSAKTDSTEIPPTLATERVEKPKTPDGAIRLKTFSGFCLEVSDNNVIPSECNEYKSEQLFFYDSNMKAIKSHHKDYCLLRSSSSVVANSCGKASAERRKWYYDPTTSQIKNWNGKCLYVGTSATTLKTCMDSDFQKFEISFADSKPAPIGDAEVAAVPNSSIDNAAAPTPSAGSDTGEASVPNSSNDNAEEPPATASAVSDEREANMPSSPTGNVEERRPNAESDQTVKKSPWFGLRSSSDDSGSDASESKEEAVVAEPTAADNASEVVESAEEQEIAEGEKTPEPGDESGTDNVEDLHPSAGPDKAVKKSSWFGLRSSGNDSGSDATESKEEAVVAEQSTRADITSEAVLSSEDQGSEDGEEMPEAGDASGGEDVAVMADAAVESPDEVVGTEGESVDGEEGAIKGSRLWGYFFGSSSSAPESNVGAGSEDDSTESGVVDHVEGTDVATGETELVEDSASQEAGEGIASIDERETDADDSPIKHQPDNSEAEGVASEVDHGVESEVDEGVESEADQVRTSAPIWQRMFKPTASPGDDGKPESQDNEIKSSSSEIEEPVNDVEAQRVKAPDTSDDKKEQDDVAHGQDAAPVTGDSGTTLEGEGQTVATTTSHEVANDEHTQIEESSETEEPTSSWSLRGSLKSLTGYLYPQGSAINSDSEVDTALSTEESGSDVKAADTEMNSQDEADNATSITTEPAAAVPGDVEAAAVAEEEAVSTESMESGEEAQESVTNVESAEKETKAGILEKWKSVASSLTGDAKYTKNAFDEEEGKETETESAAKVDATHPGQIEDDPSADNEAKSTSEETEDDSATEEVVVAAEASEAEEAAVATEASEADTTEAREPADDKLATTTTTSRGQGVVSVLKRAIVAWYNSGFALESTLLVFGIYFYWGRM